MRRSSPVAFVFTMPTVLAVSLCWCGMLMAPSIITVTSAFVVVVDPVVQRHTSLLVKKPKRRKRKDVTQEDADSLPDFDIVDPSSSPSENQNEPTETKAPIASSQSTLDEITPAMMGSSLRRETTVNDLIRDRSLESKFEFDDVVDDDVGLPDLAVLPNSNGSSGPGKKKARQAARIAAAQKRQEEKESSLLSKIPFIRDEKGEISAIKILESGTWLGIGLLVGWEVYINSPFFERAQPMIPVVYDLFL